MSVVRFFKYSAAIIVLICAIIVGTYLIAYNSILPYELTAQQQEKIWKSIYSLDHSQTELNNFKVEQTASKKLLKTLRPGEINIHITNRGFTPGSRFRLFRTTTANQSVFMGNFSASDKGELIIQGKQIHFLKDIDIIIFGHMLGEETAFTLMSEDGLTYLSSVAVPKPIIAKGPEGGVMKLRLYAKYANRVLLQCTGLKPNEEFNLMSTSCNEVHHNIVNADLNGWFQSIIDPRVIGSMGGGRVRLLCFVKMERF